MYFTGCACRNSKVLPPFDKIGHNTPLFIDDEYIPEGFILRDPSRMVQAAIDRVFEHWDERKAAGEEVFRFKAVLTAAGNVEDARYPDQMPSDEEEEEVPAPKDKSRKRKRPATSTQVPRKVSKDNAGKRSGRKEKEAIDEDMEQPTSSEDEDTNVPPRVQNPRRLPQKSATDLAPRNQSTHLQGHNGKGKERQPIADDEDPTPSPDDIADNRPHAHQSRETVRAPAARNDPGNLSRRREEGKGKEREGKGKGKGREGKGKGKKRQPVVDAEEDLGFPSEEEADNRVMTQRSTTQSGVTAAKRLPRGTNQSRALQIFRDAQRELEASSDDEQDIFPPDAEGFGLREVSPPRGLEAPNWAGNSFYRQSQWLASLCKHELFQRIVAYRMVLRVCLLHFTVDSETNLVFILVILLPR